MEGVESGGANKEGGKHFFLFLTGRLNSSQGMGRLNSSQGMGRLNSSQVMN